MTDFFLAVLHMSLLAAMTALIALPLRWVFRHVRLPAWLCVALWMAVLLRMVLPSGMFTSTFSLMRWSAPAVERQMEALSQTKGAPAADDPVENPAGVPFTIPAAQSPALPVQAPASAAPAKNGPGVWDILLWAWCAGTLALWANAAFSAVRLKLHLRTAVRQGEGQSLRWECGGIPAPFVFGLFRPKIYVPARLEGNTLVWVLRHERAHLCLGHHWLKPLFFVALAPHWFNPVLWLAWALFCRDLEVCCDEHVLKRYSDHRKDYSAALLSLAAPRQGLLLPPGFGETGVKDRIKRALRYRRPGKYAIAMAAVLAVLCICGLAADPVRPAQLEDVSTLAEPVVVVNGQRLDWTADRWVSAPYGSMLRITDPQEQDGYMALYTSLKPGQDDGQDISTLSLSSSFARGDASGYDIRLTPISAEEGQYPEQDQYYTLYYTWEDSTEDVYTFTIHTFPNPPELDLEHISIRFSGETEWEDLGALLPEPVYDGDGADELAISICAGTGVAAYPLYLFEPHGDGFADPAVLTEDDLYEQLSAGLRYADGRIILDTDSGALEEVPGIPLREIAADSA